MFIFYNILDQINTINCIYLRCFNNEMSIFVSDCCLLNVLLPRTMSSRGNTIIVPAHIDSGQIFWFSNIVWKRDHKHDGSIPVHTLSPVGIPVRPSHHHSVSDFRVVKIFFIYYFTLFICFWALYNIIIQARWYINASMRFPLCERLYHRKPNLSHLVHMHFNNNNNNNFIIMNTT